MRGQQKCVFYIILERHEDNSTSSGSSSSSFEECWNSNFCSLRSTSCSRAASHVMSSSSVTVARIRCWCTCVGTNYNTVDISVYLAAVADRAVLPPHSSNPPAAPPAPLRYRQTHLHRTISLECYHQLPLAAPTDTLIVMTVCVKCSACSSNS